VVAAVVDVVGAGARLEAAAMSAAAASDSRKKSQVPARSRKTKNDVSRPKTA
jgi:hypothetical protein